MWLLFVQLESVVHYIFLKKETCLLVVKEDLIIKVLYMSVFGIAVSCTFIRFHGEYSLDARVCNGIFNQKTLFLNPGVCQKMVCKIYLGSNQFLAPQI